MISFFQCHISKRGPRYSTVTVLLNIESEMSVFQFLLALLVIALGWVIIQKILLFRRMAPGPYGIPVLGSLIPLLKADIIDELQKYKKKYGKIFSITVGDFYVTVVADPRLIVDNLKREEFQGRPDFEWSTERNGGKRHRGVIFNEGVPWQEQRRFTLRHLRDFGFGKNSMEGMLLYELQELIGVLREDVGHPVSLSGVFNASVLNSLWSIIAGNRFELSDPKLKTLITLLIDNLKNSSITTPAFFFYLPFKYGLVGRSILKQSLQFRQRLRELLFGVIDEHWNTFKEGQIRDFIDAFIQQIRDSSEGSSFFGEEGRMNLYTVLFDLFIGGAETTSTTLQWAILFMSRNPEVQRKVHNEIDNVIGKSKPPNNSDKDKLVYLEATLNEVHRMAALVPVSVYHKAVEDAEINGYLVPKDSVLFFSIYDALHDKNYWKDPECFRPKRFLDSSGTKLIRHEPFIPFSIGKRQCLGQSLAVNTLFLFFTGLLQKYKFEIDPACADQDLKGSSTFVSSPKPFKVIMQERK